MHASLQGAPSLRLKSLLAYNETGGQRPLQILRQVWRHELGGFRCPKKVLWLCSHAIPRPQLIAMVEVLGFMQGVTAQLCEAETWMLPLLHQAMHSLTQTFVTATLPRLTRQGNGSKVSCDHLMTFET